MIYYARRRKRKEKNEETTTIYNLNKKNKRDAITAASLLTMAVLVFAAYGVTAMSSFSISSSPLQTAYAQEQQGQQQSAIADKATTMSAAVDAALRYYAKAIGEQYVEADVRPIPGAENINALEDVTIPSVPVGNNEGNTTGIVSMGDYLIATGLIDKSYELFLDTARVMHNVTIEDVNELQTTLLQFHTLIDQRAPYTLAEDVVQNLQGHLQRTVASTEQFTSSGTTTAEGGGAAMTTGTTEGGAAADTGTPSDTLGNATTTTSSTTTTPSDTGAATDTGTTSDTTTTLLASPLMQ